MRTEKFNFQSAYAELEKIVTEFESRDIDLDTDLPKFEKGMKLARQLQQRLKEVENQINEINHKFNQDEEQE